MTTQNHDETSLGAADLSFAKWGWACRDLSRDDVYGVISTASATVGDVLVAQVEEIRNHTRLMTAGSERVRMYEGDLIVGVVGNRYATDAFEGYGVIEEGSADLLTNAGMMGQVSRRNPAVRAPTRLKIIGRLVDARGVPINLIERCFTPRLPGAVERNVVLVLGTGMNAGKTTSATKLVRGLMNEGQRVAAIKVTGSVSPNDRNELEATGASFVRDFSDYGFPSTYLESLPRVRQLFHTMVSDATDAGVDVVVVELADGILQRETEALLADSTVRERTVGAVLAAPCALSALMGCQLIQNVGIDVLGVTGRITNAPLFVDELERRSTIPVLSSRDAGQSLGRAVVSVTRTGYSGAGPRKLPPSDRCLTAV